MTTQKLFFIIFTVLLLSIGQVLFKLASESLKAAHPNILFALLNTKLIIALIIYALATFLWLLVLKDTPLKLAYPFVAMAFVFVPILSYFILGESLKWNNFLGAGFIIVGVIVSVL